MIPTRWLGIVFEGVDSAVKELDFVDVLLQEFIFFVLVGVENAVDLVVVVDQQRLIVIVIGLLNIDL